MKTAFAVIVVVVLVALVLYLRNRNRKRPSTEPREPIPVPGLGIVTLDPDVEIDDVDAFLEKLRRVHLDALRQFNRIYRRTIGFEINIELVPTAELPDDHRAVYFKWNKWLIVLGVEGYDGKSAFAWYVGELHNAYRHRAELPSEPSAGDDLDTGRYAAAQAYWRGFE